VLQVIALSAKRHGMAFGLMLRQLKKIRSGDGPGLAERVCNFLKQNGLGIGALAAAMRQLDPVDRNGLVRRIAAVLVGHGFPYAALSLEGNLVRLTDAVIRKMSESTRSYMVRTLGALDVVEIPAGESDVHAWDRSNERAASDMVMLDEAWYDREASNKVLVPVPFGPAACTSIGDPKGMEATAIWSALGVDRSTIGCWVAIMQDMSREPALRPVDWEVEQPLAAPKRDEEVPADEADSEDSHAEDAAVGSHAEIHEGRAYGIIRAGCSTAELAYFTRWQEEKITNASALFWGVLKGYLRAKYLSYWDALVLRAQNAWADKSPEAKKDVIVCQQKKAYIRAWLKQPNGVPQHPSAAAANAVVKHIRKQRVKEGHAAPDVSLAALHALLYDGKVDAQALAPDTHAHCSFDELKEAFAAEIRTAFDDAFVWVGKVVKVDDALHRQIVGSLRDEVDSIYKRVNASRTVPVLAATRAPFLPDGLAGLEAIGDVDDDGDDWGMDNLDLANPEAAGHERAIECEIDKDEWGVFAVWCSANPGLSSEYLEPLQVAQNFYGRGIVDDDDRPEVTAYEL